MIRKLLHNFSKLPLFASLYLVSVLMLFPGLYSVEGIKHFDKIAIHLFSFLFFYFCISYFYNEKLKLFVKTIGERIHINANLISAILFYGTIIFIFIHFIWLNYFPFFKQWLQVDILKTAFVRQELYEQMPTFIAYPLSLVVKAIIPFSLLLFIYTNEKYKFFIYLVICIFYTVNLLQKNFLVFILLPSILYLLFSKKYWHSGLLFLLMTCNIYLLVFSSNPHLRGYNNQEEIKDSPAATALVTSGLFQRLFFVPGKVASVWFINIPKKYPFLYGDGYNYVAKLKGSNYIDYSKKLYKEYYPEYAKKGLHGTVNTAGFIVDYANFGYPGLWLSGLPLAIIFVFLSSFYLNNKIFFALNFMNVMLLNSGYITSIFFSGGWLLTALLYVSLKNNFEK